MDNVLILKLDSENLYFFKVKEKYNLQNYYKKNYPIWIFYLLKILDIMHISIYFFLGSWKKNISKFNTIIIIPNNYNYGIAKYIKKKNKNCKIICYFLDIIFDANKKVLFDKNIDEFWTFDKRDAENYNMKYFHQFYTKEIKLPKSKILYDTFFLGLEKGRKTKLEEIGKIFKYNSLEPYIKIINKETDYITYKEYLKKVSQSKTILDIVNDNQTGLTLRCMESIFFEKKLITNNKSIKQYDFYDKNNIYIMGESNQESLIDFVNGKYKKISKDIINKYDIDNWINELIRR